MIFLIFSIVVGTDVKSVNLGLISLEKNRESVRLFELIRHNISSF